MKGAIIGDICGSVYEFNNILSKDFPLLSDQSCFTDDTVMTCAVAHSLTTNGIYGGQVAHTMRFLGQAYPDAGYGKLFRYWLFHPELRSNNSCGNGAAMRVSPVGFWAKNEYKVREMSRAVTEVSHYHPEALKGAECTAMMVYLAKHGASKDELRKIASENYNYVLLDSLEELREQIKGDGWKTICQNSVPQAISCFLLSDNFEDCIRNCISIGGDSDTIAAIAGGIAEAYYGEEQVEPIWNEIVAAGILDSVLLMIVDDFYDALKAQ